MSRKVFVAGGTGVLGRASLRVLVEAGYLVRSTARGNDKADLVRNLGAEPISLITDEDVPDGVYEEARKRFSEAELVNLTPASVTNKGWNRLSIAFRTVPGTYQLAAAHAAVAKESER